MNPFRLAASRQATFPKGTAFGGGGKVSGITQRRPLGGAAERSEAEGVLPYQKAPRTSGGNAGRCMILLKSAITARSCRS